MLSRDHILASMRERVHHPAGIRELLQLLKVPRDERAHGEAVGEEGGGDTAARSLSFLRARGLAVAFPPTLLRTLLESLD